MKRRSEKKQRILKKDLHQAVPDNDTEGDFIFRFDLLAQREQPLYEEPIVEMVREQLNNLLNIVVLTSKGSEIKVDGFKFLNNLEVKYEIFNREESPKV